MIETWIAGPLGVAGVAAAWVGVQSAWRRTFPGDRRDPDCLAGRTGCRGCAGEEASPPRSPRFGAGRHEEETT